MRMGGPHSSKCWEAAGVDLRKTSPPRGLELAEACLRAHRCCVKVYTQVGKRFQRGHPFAINIQLTDVSNDAPRPELTEGPRQEEPAQHP